ncbi:hypothetical protein TWF730_000110 [Orbilia blumenaviensis]|uniref:Uncharacterized protein n=1 Tax=Orbilia blumenaviensis TaxID=1796055 RepID=A0AAV9VMQ7_9PEZI
MRLRYLTSFCLLQQALGFEYFTNIANLGNEPTLATGDTSEYRIPIDGETFAQWERTVDSSGLIEAFLKFYRKADMEWESLFYGLSSEEPYNYNARAPCFNERIDKTTELLLDTYKAASKGEEPPIWFSNMIITWGNILYEVVMSTRENPFYDVPAADEKDIPVDWLYPVPMFNKDFAENFRDALDFADFPLSRPTADHIHLILMPQFRGPRDPDYRNGAHVKSRYERVARYLLNAVEVSAGAGGEGARNHEFQFVVSDLDVSLEHSLVTVYVDPNKTTRMRETLLKVRDRLSRIMNKGLEQAWDIRTEMGFLDSKIAGINKTIEERERAEDERVKAAEAKRKAKALAQLGFVPGDAAAGEEQQMNILPRKRRTPLFDKWQVLKDLIIDVTYLPSYLIKDIDSIAEVLRVMIVPQLPSSENSLELAKDISFNPEPVRNMRISNIETMASPINRDTSPGGYSAMLPAQGNGEGAFRVVPSDLGPEPSDRAFEDLLNVIPISIELGYQDLNREAGPGVDSEDPVELTRAGSDPIGADNLKLLSTDVSPEGRSLLHPGYSPSPRSYSPPRRSLFSGTSSRFSDVIIDNKINE